MNGKVVNWWKETKTINKIRNSELNLRMFKKYLIERYYNEKAKEFHELKLGQLSIEYFENKFVNLMRYVPYLHEEKEKVQRFMRCFPQVYK